MTDAGSEQVRESTCEWNFRESSPGLSLSDLGSEIWGPRKKLMDGFDAKLGVSGSKLQLQQIATSHDNNPPCAHIM